MHLGSPCSAMPWGWSIWADWLGRGGRFGRVLEGKPVCQGDGMWISAEYRINCHVGILRRISHLLTLFIYSPLLCGVLLAPGTSPAREGLGGDGMCRSNPRSG